MEEKYTCQQRYFIIKIDTSGGIISCFFLVYRFIIQLSINPERLMRTKAIQDGQSKKSKLEPDIGSKNSSSNHGFNPVKTCYLPLVS
jgi:hypothetical protein